MHEFSLINDLMRKIDTVAREQNAKRVTAAKVRLGALAHISADHFREHFEESARGTIADGAKLQVETLTDENDPQAQDIVLESLEVEQ
jgi:hydrogenase nickel incorporation protein HypA/HybF